MVIYLVRHGATAGNLQGRYIGTTDEPLCRQGKKELEERAALPGTEALFVSPMLRCRQTADILYPGMEQHVVADFRECDFGAFENKNYKELSGDPAYQAWVDSGGRRPFPGGESREQFQERCVDAFCAVCRRARAAGWESFACVVHGGTIMSILEALARPEQDYFSYQTKNGGGYAVLWEERDGNKFEHMVDFELSVWYAF